ncbi:ABC transporter permease [Cohnella lubricantis]|uniref:Sugar ABC transporter permease n=1 Tax=Cohnella lubricantis TaxID=2163172 RepID=A0A841T4V6_9BACL|nr:ABC transporter permease subunit [Cohnella lubricantis]MBB6675882.1 sugar ABC transporter permease [Cohnella lubricantis]
MPNAPSASRLARLGKRIVRDRQLLILFTPCIVFYLVFRYGPLYGLIIAFKDYSVFKGIIDSPWVGLENFEKFFNAPEFWQLFRNTFLLGFLTLVFSFPVPILLAVLLNEIRLTWFKKFVQTASYLPTFLSVVIISSMIIDFLSPTNGVVNKLLNMFGIGGKYFLIDPDWFRPIYIMSEIWTNSGYESIVYLAAVAGISPTLYEAAKVDGAGRFRMMFNVTIPSIMPTILIMLILKTGQMITIGYEKVLLLYNTMTYDVADVFSTFVYRKGLLGNDYSYGAAVGLFEAFVAMALLLISNHVSKRMGGNGLW